MTESLQNAFNAASRLPANEQDEIARWLMAELESDAKWAELFAGSSDVLASLAAEALSEHKHGETLPLDQK